MLYDGPDDHLGVEVVYIRAASSTVAHMAILMFSHRHCNRHRLATLPAGLYVQAPVCLVGKASERGRDFTCQT